MPITSHAPPGTPQPAPPLTPSSSAETSNDEDSALLHAWGSTARPRSWSHVDQDPAWKPEGGEGEEEGKEEEEGMTWKAEVMLSPSAGEEAKYKIYIVS